MSTKRDEAIRELEGVKGLGGVRAAQVYDELGLGSLEELIEAGERGELRALKGVGAKTQVVILDSARALLDERMLGDGETEVDEVVVETSEVDEVDDGRSDEASFDVQPTIKISDLSDEVETIEIVDGSGAFVPVSVLEKLVCPNCGAEGLSAGATLSCGSCRREYLVRNGVFDLAPPYARRGGWAQRVMETRFYSSFYEDVMRPRLTGLVSKRTLSQEYMLSAELLELEQGARVLDVACGTGNFTRHFAQELEQLGGGEAIVGADVSWPMLEEARRYVERDGLSDDVVLVRADATRLPFGRGSFDRLHCSAALHLMEDIDGALRNFARVLTPGGVCVIGTFIAGEGLVRRLFKKATPKPVRFHWFSQKELRQRVERAGFDVELESVSGDAISLKARRRA